MEPNGSAIHSIKVYEARPTMSETRAPHIRRLKISRPFLSSPIGQFQLGLNRVSRTSTTSLCPYGARIGASSAIKTKSVTMMSPMSANRLRMSRRNASAQRLEWGRVHSSPLAPRAASDPASAETETESAFPKSGLISCPSPRMTGVGVSKECSEARDIVSPGRRLLVPNTRVDKCVDDIDQNVHQRQEDPIDQDDRHDHGLVLGQHALDVELAHAGNVEHLLDEEGPRADGREDGTNDGDDRDQGVLENVLDDDFALRETLRAGGADVIGANHLHHAATRIPGDRSQRGRSERQGGKNPFLLTIPAHHREAKI